jgi:hypothetical protein
MARITMISLKIHPGDQKSVHFKSLANAQQWLNLNSFESFSAYVFCADGKNHRKVGLKYTGEFVDWVKSL